MREHGAHIAAYDTTADALDLVAVRQALGLAQWDVWGVSYGTRVAFELMRHDPASIRSVVMEAAVPPEAAVFGGGAAALDMAITRMRDDCLADPECADHFGDIRESVAAVAARLHDQPLPARFHGDDGIERDLVVTKEMFLRTVAVNFYDMEYVVDVPMMVDATLHGDYRLLSEFVTSFAGGLKYDEGSNNALLLSHLCRDEFPFEPMAALRHPPAAAAFDGARSPLRELVLCPDWAGSADATVNMPVEGDLPVLFLSGAYDVATPTAWSRAAMMHLPNAYLVEFPDAAHKVLPDDPCGIDLAGTFLENPSADPRSGLDCLMPVRGFSLMP